MNRNKLIIFILLCLMSLSLLGQEDYTLYYKETRQAFTYMAMKEYNKAINIYEQVFIDFYPFPDDLKNLKNCYLANKDTLSAYKVVLRMIACGWELEEKPPIEDNKNTIVHNIGLGNSILEQKIKEEYFQRHTDYRRTINQIENQYLESLKIGEAFAQATRSRIWQNKKHYSKTQKEMLINEVFETNRLLLINLLKRKNLSRKHISAWNGQFMEITLLHAVQTAPPCDFEYMMTLLQKEVIKRNLHPIVYATIYDTYLCVNKKKKNSYYGQYAEGFSSGNPQCVNVQDAEKVDERRLAIGLPPLWAWCDYYHINYPQNYIPQK